MLFKNISVLNENFTVDENMYVATDGAVIIYIGKEAPQLDYGRVIDGSGKLLMSAFYNAHTHTPMTLMRGYGENLSLEDWLNTRIFPFEDHLDSNAVYWGTMLSMAESAKNGIVSSSDMYYFCEDIARAVKESGLKANISRSIANPFGADVKTLASLDEMKHLYENYHNTCDGRIKIDISLHAEYTSNRETAEALAEYTNLIKNTITHIHVSETKFEHEECIKRHGMTPAAYLADTGLFNVPAIAAHCVYATDDDLEIFKEKGVTIALNPVSNMKLASGMTNVANIKKHGVAFAIGTDSVASNNSLNFFEEMKVMLLSSKIANNNPIAISAEEALEAATLTGAKAQGRNDAGAVKTGNRADLIMLDMTVPQLHPVHNMANNLAYSCSGSEIVMTICDGQVIYENGEYKTIDIEKTIFEVEAATKKILRKL